MTISKILSAAALAVAATVTSAAADEPFVSQHENAADACVAEAFQRKYDEVKNAGGGVINLTAEYMAALIGDCEFQTGVKADKTVPPEGFPGMVILVKGP
jgi:hypothetical protein